MSELLPSEYRWARIMTEAQRHPTHEVLAALHRANTLPALRAQLEPIVNAYIEQGVRIAELEAQAENAQDAADQWRDDAGRLMEKFERQEDELAARDAALATAQADAAGARAELAQRDRTIEQQAEALDAATDRVRLVEQQQLELSASATDLRRFASEAEQLAAKLQRRVA